MREKFSMFTVYVYRVLFTNVARRGAASAQRMQVSDRERGREEPIRERDFRGCPIRGQGLL